MTIYLFFSILFLTLKAQAEENNSAQELIETARPAPIENPLIPATIKKNKYFYTDLSVQKNITSSQENNFVGTVANTYSSNILSASLIAPTSKPVFIELRGQYRQYEPVENQNKKFDLGSGHDLGIFGHFLMPDNQSTMGAGLGTRRYEYVGLKNSSDTSSAGDINKLSVQRFNMIWTAVNYFQSTEVFGQTGRLKIAGTYALLNEHQLANGQQEDNQYIELEFEYRHYLSAHLWLAAEGKFARQQSSFSTINHLGQQLSMGILF